MRNINTERSILILILLLSALVRVWGINYDLPYVYHPDEPVYIRISQNIFKTGDLNPHFFNYPSLFFYINALAYGPYYVLGKLMGVFSTPQDILPPVSLIFGVTRAQMPTAVLLGRLVTVGFGVGVVGLTYLSGKRLTDRSAVGLLAALMVAISPTNVWNSHFIIPDTFVTFFAVASFLASILIYQQGKLWQYAIGGISVGLTAASKYNGALIVCTLVAAHFLRHGRAALRKPPLYLALSLCGVAFLATTPFAVLDHAAFMQDLRFEAQHYTTGHPGMEGNTLRWYLDYMWSNGGLLYPLALLGIVLGFRKHPKKTGLLAAFPVIYFVFINRFVVRNARTLLPITPFLFLAAAWILVDLFDQLRAGSSGVGHKRSPLVFISLGIIVLAIPVYQTFRDIQGLTTLDSRETARVWIAENLPPGAKIAIEPYAPFIDPAQFSVWGMEMLDHEAEWYVKQGFDYLVFSEGMYGRFYKEPEKYSQEVQQYENLFRRFDLVMMFTDGDYEIQIYAVE
jgi:4-amino-4-deoxy-L-arabinose transferase-like glycosyltransferase